MDLLFFLATFYFAIIEKKRGKKSEKIEEEGAAANM